jgi:5'-methylthioadenosine phosphorylase
MAHLGVTRLIAPTAAGSLQPHIKPGEFVVCDQFVDRTYARDQTFYDGPRVVHISSANPYCPDLRVQSIEVGRDLGIAVHERGTVVVIQGPRFSTRAESQWFSRQGWEVVNMTQYPEVALARELAMCYVNIALITDYDAGLEGEAGIEPVTVSEVVQVMHANNDRVRELIRELVPRLDGARPCACARALDNAVIS